MNWILESAVVSVKSMNAEESANMINPVLVIDRSLKVFVAEVMVCVLVPSKMTVVCFLARPRIRNASPYPIESSLKDI